MEPGERDNRGMKKIVLLFSLLFLLCTSMTVQAEPDPYTRLDLIADNVSLWKQEEVFGLWGYAVTDLDRNGRPEIISASLQGTGMYTYIIIFEAAPEGNSLTEIIQDRDPYASAPDIMVNSTEAYYDPEADIYYYIFDDGIRNGYAELYENKRAVYIKDGIWKEIPLANKATFFTDMDNFTVSYSDPDGNPISEIQYETAAETFFSGITPAEVCFNWQMMSTVTFAGLDHGELLESLKAASSPVCQP